MTHTTSDARKRRFSGPLHSSDIDIPPTVPRVAESLDDLAVGQWVACWMRDYTSDAVTLRETWHWSAFEITEGQLKANWDDQDWSRVVILADAPPAADWLVPADKMEALREAMTNYDGMKLPHLRADAIAAARAVLDAATEVQS